MTLSSIKCSRFTSLSALETLNESCFYAPGLYIIRRPKPVKRVFGVDPAGLLYIGKSKNISHRLSQFLRSYHTASSYLWYNLHLTKGLFGRSVSRGRALKACLQASLEVRVVGPLSERFLAGLERALLYAYLSRFGELPPLNFSAPRRFHRSPGSERLTWAAKILRAT